MSNTLSCTSVSLYTGLRTVRDRGPTRCHLLFDGLNSERLVHTSHPVAGHAPGVWPTGRLQSIVEMGGRPTTAGSPSQKCHVRSVDASV